MSDETWIKMCEEAQKELQTDHEWKVGDRFYDGEHYLIYSLSEDEETGELVIWASNLDNTGEAIYEAKGLVYEPTQEQLQEMYDETAPAWMVQAEFTDWTLDDDVPIKRKYETITELWLHFVMQKKFNKHWNAETEQWEVRDE